MAEKIAKRFAEYDSGTPVPAASNILRELSQDAFSDPYGNVFSVFDAIDSESIAQILCLGFDGEPGTEDDISWIVFKDGSIHERSPEK